jgi:septum formation protein
MANSQHEIPLILASSSPRRGALLRQAGIAFGVVSPPFCEPAGLLANLMPAQQAEALAYFKARSVQRDHRDAFLLGADTLASIEGRALGKPADAAEARSMLESLSGTRHEVTTGVALLGPAGERLIASETTRVTMRRMTGSEIDGYVNSGEWRGKAGGYSLQETTDRFIRDINGSFSNVVGLPIELVTRMIDELRQRSEAHRAT